MYQLLNHSQWARIPNRPQIAWRGWGKMSTEDMRKQIEKIGNTGVESGALGGNVKTGLQIKKVNPSHWEAL